MATVQGVCHAKFEKLKILLQDSITSGDELGASISLNVGGKEEVDIYGGYADEGRARPWVKDTIVNVWSSTKTVSALAVLILHDRGLLDVDENVCKYWPEFAANGKDQVKVRHILSHSSGVSGWQEPVTLEDIYDVERAADKLAQQAPWWEPGSASGYHSLTMGHLLGELVRRVSGKSLTQFVADEISGPLGADFQIGAKESDWPRISNLIPPTILASDFDPDSIIHKTFYHPPPSAVAMNTAAWRNAELGAVNGHTNAKALCTILSAITLGGTVDGYKLLSQKTIDRIFEIQTDGIDHVFGIPIRFGIGYAIAGGGTEQAIPFIPKGENRRVACWGGWGGSWIVCDLDNRLTFAYTMNKMRDGVLGSTQTAKYINTVYEIIDSAGEKP